MFENKELESKYKVNVLGIRIVNTKPKKVFYRGRWGVKGGNVQVGVNVLGQGQRGQADIDLVFGKGGQRFNGATAVMQGLGSKGQGAADGHGKKQDERPTFFKRWSQWLIH
jgi:hypothetical protein